MSDSSLTPPEERVEEIRAIRRRLFGGLGSDYAKLRELGNRFPEGFRVLRHVRPITPLALQLEAERAVEEDR